MQTIKKRSLARKQKSLKQYLQKVGALLILDLVSILYVFAIYDELYQPITYVNPRAAEISEKLNQVPAVTSSPVEEIHTLGYEDITEKIMHAFPEDKQTALAIAYAESHLNPMTPSNSDIMADGRPFSIGLFQINLTWHKLAGTDCSKAFKGKNYKAVVINEELYAKCVELAQDPMISIDTAQGIYHKNGKSFVQWSTYTTKTYMRFLAQFNS